ncbi:hypothetical protein [Cardiobacterium hominis]|jgi:hypothetical protein|uniref:hypothetical protein n=1 Tax=Cardiobacterium hominis TaxID=2718 RepID=UPI0006604A16|nr:hypothetical protein [Cardiobacterium hominis]
MKVRAIAKGYYGGQIRSIGDEFDVPDTVSGAWFAPVMTEGLNPLEPDNHAVGDDLGADGLNPTAEGLNPEPQGVEPTPAEGVNPTPEAKPETDNKTRKPNKQEDLK